MTVSSTWNVGLFVTGHVTATRVARYNHLHIYRRSSSERRKRRRERERACALARLRRYLKGHGRVSSCPRPHSPTAICTSCSIYRLRSPSSSSSPRSDRWIISRGLFIRADNLLVEFFSKQSQCLPISSHRAFASAARLRVFLINVDGAALQFFLFLQIFL